MKRIIVIFSIFWMSGCIVNQHHADLKNIKKGMHVNEVNQLMSPPDSVFSGYLFRKDEFAYMYNTSVGMSDNIYIVFSITDSIVIKVIDGQ